MNKQTRTGLTLGLATLLVTATGCAAAPDRPDKQLTRAETSIEFAEQNGAREFGSSALDRARQNLEMAYDYADQDEYRAALRAAEKAELDAELAAAQANTSKADEALAEIRESIETLRREIARNGIS
ncbi:DUF4398 domain-containing protein [Elongatibacter sediminis]|uniref:DUF4398 domain-containing protein n=1 Tax=Elongatibacter sediminis TaxID=3119006 RepID=A0AAW9RBI0_9GAMM